MPERLNLVGDDAIYVGDGYELLFPLVNPDGTPLDPTGWEFEAQIRRSAGASDPVVTFTIDVVTGEIVDAHVPGGWALLLALTSDQTIEVGRRMGGIGAWDMQAIEEGAEPDTWLYGQVRTRGQVTI